MYVEDADGIFNMIDKLNQELGNFKVGNVATDVAKIRKVADELSNKSESNTYYHKRDIITRRDPKPILPNINNIGREIKRLLEETFPNDFTFDIHKILYSYFKRFKANSN
jgi:hypothetical protein